MHPSFYQGFVKAAVASGFTTGQAIDFFKNAIASGAFSTPSFTPPQQPAPTTPIVDTMKPSSMFPSPTNGSLGKPVGGLGTTPSPQNFGFNINQTGLGGINNSVTSAPSSTINGVLNKPVGAPMV